MADDFPPVIDGCLGACNELFAMLLAYLKGFNLTAASRLLIVADGAAWIWRRVPGLLKALGLKSDQAQQLIDLIVTTIAPEIGDGGPSTQPFVHVKQR